MQRRTLIGIILAAIGATPILSFFAWCFYTVARFRLWPWLTVRPEWKPAHSVAECGVLAFAVVGTIVILAIGLTLIFCDEE